MSRRVRCVDVVLVSLLDSDGDSEEISRFADNHWLQILDLPTSKRASVNIQRSPTQSNDNNKAPLQVRNPRRSVRNRSSPKTLHLVAHSPVPFLRLDIQRPYDPLLGPMVSGGRRLPQTRRPRPIEPDQHARLLARRAREWWWRPTTTNLDSILDSCAVIRGVSVYERGWYSERAGRRCRGFGEERRWDC
jgi:hypothetical protein